MLAPGSRRTLITWADLERVQLELRSQDGEVFDQLYWQFVRGSGFEVHIPVAAGEARMLQEFTKHFGRVDTHPLKRLRELIRIGETRSPLQMDVWVRPIIPAGFHGAWLQ